MKAARLCSWGVLVLALATAIAVPLARAGHAAPSGSVAAIRLRCLDVLGAKPGAHVWGVSGDTWAVYDSLYSRPLRALLSHQPAGATVWIDTDPAAPTYVGQPQPHGAEVRDLTAFCAAHGVRVSFAPIS